MLFESVICSNRHRAQSLLAGLSDFFLHPDNAGVKVVTAFDNGFSVIAVKEPGLLGRGLPRAASMAAVSAENVEPGKVTTEMAWAGRWPPARRRRTTHAARA